MSQRIDVSRKVGTNYRANRAGLIDASALAREHAVAAIAALVRGLRDPQHYTTCATALLDRGFGRPAQHVTTESDNHITLHLLAARAIAAELPVIDAKPVDTEQKSNGGRLHLFDVPDE